MAVPRIETEGVAVARGGRQILGGIDLRVQAGQVVAVAGPSGVGKSSLLRCLVRLDEPAAGRVLVDGATPRGSSHASCGGASAS